MARLKIKTQESPRDRRTKLHLTELLAKADVYANSIHEARDGLIVNTSTVADVGRILESDVIKTLLDNGFSPIIPKGVKSWRTVICYRVDSLAYDNSINDIADAIEIHQEWAKVQTVYKFPNTTGKKKFNLSQSPWLKKHSTKVSDYTMSPLLHTKSRKKDTLK